jgi:hypothetical protein
MDAVSSKRDDFVLDQFAFLDAINGAESRHFPVETHPA